MASNDLEVKLRIKADANGADAVLGAAADDLKKMGDVAAKAGKSGAAGIDSMGDAAKRAEAKAKPAHRGIADGVKSISKELNEVKNLYLLWQGAMQAASAASGVAATADAYANLRARLKLVVGDGQALQEAFAGVQRVALATNSTLESTGTLFAKVADVGKKMGVSQQDALRLVETINQSILLSGASAQAADAAIVQLIQGLQSGVVRGDEFNSIMEQSPRLSRAMADGLGVTTGGLRKMAEAGQLTAETVIAALQGQAQAIEGEFAQLPATIGRALTNLESQWQLFIGSLDESTGASSLAAKTIDLLASNFDFLASALMNAGQAWLGWKAYNMAAEFLSLKTAVVASTAAKAADTAATVANTAATAANTSAQVANNAAKAGAAAAANGVAGAANGAAGAVGRLAGALSLVKGLSFAFLLTNIVDIGKWLGEAAAKAMGYGKVLEDAERKMRALDAATQAQKDADAALAQQARLAADAKLELSARAQRLIADFAKLKESGDTTAQAIKKVAEALDLSDVAGISEAGAALDALAVRGQIGADQVGEAWRRALDGMDLQVFEANARAAFGDTELGARRLAAALDAQLGEALRRTKLDAGALAGGVNQAAQQAINDFDVLLERYSELKKRGVDAGIALAASLDQAAGAATTAAAAQAVVERWEALGRAGLVAGERLAQGLAAAKGRLDELTPGINSVEEALKALGVVSDAALKQSATAARDAFRQIAESGKASAREIEAAFTAYAEKAVAANGGVVDSALRSEAAMRGLQVRADEAGKVTVQSFLKAREETKRLEEQANKTAGSMGKIGDAAADSADKVIDAATNAADAARSVSTSITTEFHSAVESLKDTSKYANEAAESVWKAANAGKALWEAYDWEGMGAAVKDYASQMERLDEQQKSLSSSGAAGVEELRLKLLELSGSEEQIARARAARDISELERKKALLQIELHRAQLRNDTTETAYYQTELGYLAEQIKLTDQLARATEKKRQEEAKKKAAESAAKTATDQKASPTRLNQNAVTINVNGVTDPVKLARLVEPELKKLERLAK